MSSFASLLAQNNLPNHIAPFCHNSEPPLPPLENSNKLEFVSTHCKHRFRPFLRVHDQGFWRYNALGITQTQMCGLWGKSLGSP